MITPPTIQRLLCVSARYFGLLPEASATVTPLDIARASARALRPSTDGGHRLMMRLGVKDQTCCA